MGSETAGSGAKPAKKRGRKPGSPKVGGSGWYAPPPDLKGAPLRAWMLDRSGALENLIRLSCGKPIRLHGPTGRIIWHYPDVAQIMWATERVLKKALPDLAGLQLSGDADSPITTRSLTDSTLGADRELARRLTLLQGIIDQPQDAAEPPTSGVALNGHHTAAPPLDAPGESPNAVCSPPVGEAVTLDSDRSITVTRMNDDGRSDHGGDWEVKCGGKPVKTLRGITMTAAALVVDAMSEDGHFDGE